MKKFLYLIPFVLFLSACAANSPSVQISPKSYNFGSIQVNSKPVSAVFKVKNIGGGVLVVRRLSTSCGCTTAEIAKKEIYSGQEANMTVTFDPSVHLDLRGKFKRVVYLQTNDKENQEIEIDIDGNIVDDKKDKAYHGHEEGLRSFEISPETAYEKLKNDSNIILVDVRTPEEFSEGYIKNAILVPVQEISKKTLDRKGIGVEMKNKEIIVYCRSGARSAKAQKIMASLGYKNVKSVAGGLIHWEEDFLPVEKGENKEKIKKKENNAEEKKPRISFDRLKHDFGKIKKEDGKVSTNFTVKNTGDGVLEIGKIYTSCGCTAGKISSKKINPGKNAVLTVVFDPNYHKEPEGRFKRTVFLETNDLEEEEAIVEIFVEIEK